ncbi:MAG: mechanosensitive ion channel [Parvularculaceae bacterium]|nr:mechanosensitive ion channel [Parvularculaceae bacterium]
MNQIRMEIERSFEGFVAFLPNVLGAIGLAVLGLILARLVSEFVRNRIDKSRIGMAANREAISPGNPSLGKSLGAAVFWFILLLFIAPILTTLGLSETLAPLNTMLTTVMDYLPRIAGAALIIGIGFVIATVARRAVTSLLSAAPIDHAARRAEIGDLIKGTEIARAFGLIVYVLILILFLLPGLEALAIASITAPLTVMLQTMLNAIPNIVAAALILFVFTLFSRAVRSLIVSVLTGVGFDNFWRQLGIVIEHGDMADMETAPKSTGITPTVVVANIAMAAMLIVGAITAAQQLNIEPVSTALSEILAVGGQILLGSIVILAGIPISRFVANTLRRAGDARSELVATAVQWGIMVLVTAIGIREMGLGADIIYAGFVLILGAAALAAALAFGIGGRGAAARFLERLDRDDD